MFQAQSTAEAEPWWQEGPGRWDLQVQSLSLGGAQSVTLGRQQGPRGGDRKPLQIHSLEGGGGVSPSIQITSQPCLDQLDPQPLSQWAINIYGPDTIPPLPTGMRSTILGTHPYVREPAAHHPCRLFCL